MSGAAGLNTILDLTVEGAVYPSLIKDIQRHPVRRTVLHVDFIQVDLNAEITVTVPVRLDGEAKQVIQGNGLVDLLYGGGAQPHSAPVLQQPTVRGSIAALRDVCHPCFTQGPSSSPRARAAAACPPP